MKRARIIGLVLGAPGMVCPAYAQALGQGGEAGVSIWRVLAALGLCLLLAVAAAFALRARARGGALFAAMPVRNRRLTIIETIRLTHQTNLVLLRCDDRELLIATSMRGAKLLDRLPAPPIDARPAGE